MIDDNGFRICDQQMDLQSCYDARDDIASKNGNLNIGVMLLYFQLGIWFMVFNWTHQIVIQLDANSVKPNFFWLFLVIARAGGGRYSDVVSTKVMVQWSALVPPYSQAVKMWYYSNYLFQLQFNKNLCTKGR